MATATHSAECHMTEELEASYAEVESITILLLIRAIKSHSNSSFNHMAAHLLINQTELSGNINGRLLLEALLEVASYSEIGLLKSLLHCEHLADYNETIAESIELIYYEPQEV